MNDQNQTTNFSYLLTRVDDDGNAQIIDLDDFQVVFDAEQKQVRANLSGEQVTRLKGWEWPRLTNR